MTTTLLPTPVATTPLKENTCPDHDHDCLTMTLAHAQWCHDGLTGHPCFPPNWKGLGACKGSCPILTRAN